MIAFLKLEKNFILIISRGSVCPIVITYGLPFFSQNEEFLKKISKISTIVKYNWPPLDEFEIFRDSNKFDDFLQNLNLSGDLKTYKDHRSQLHFIDLQWIINNSLNKIIKKLKTL